MRFPHKQLIVFLSLSLALSCGRQPKTFDVQKPVKQEPQSVRTQSVNVTAAAELALQTRQNEQVMFLVAASHNEGTATSSQTGAHVSTSPTSLSQVSVAATPSLYPCGGDLPPCDVKQRESGGDYSAVNPTGCGGFSCGGAWQFDPRTWNGYGGYQFAQDAPPDVQDAKARELWAGGAGCSHWSAC